MPRPHGGVADCQPVDEGVSFGSTERSPVEVFVFQCRKIGTVPAFGVVELLHHCLADGFAAHIFRNKPWGIKRTIFVAVDFLKDQPQHRGVDERSVFFLDSFSTLGGKIVGIQKRKQIRKRRYLFGVFVGEVIVQNAIPKQRQRLAIIKAIDVDGGVFQFRNFKQRAVEVRNPPKFGLDRSAAVDWFFGQNLKEQFKKLVKIGNRIANIKTFQTSHCTQVTIFNELYFFTT